MWLRVQADHYGQHALAPAPPTVGDPVHHSSRGSCTVPPLGPILRPCREPPAGPRVVAAPVDETWRTLRAGPAHAVRRQASDTMGRPDGPADRRDTTPAPVRTAGRH